METQSNSINACLGISHLKGVKQTKGQEESQEEKKLEARKGEYNTPVDLYTKNKSNYRPIVCCDVIYIVE